MNGGGSSKISSGNNTPDTGVRGMWNSFVDATNTVSDINNNQSKKSTLGKVTNAMYRVGGSLNQVVNGLDLITSYTHGTDLSGGVVDGADQLGMALSMIPLEGAVEKVILKGAAKVLAKTSGWVKRSVFNSLDPAIQKKVAAAIENGIVAPTGKQGIIKLTATEAAQTGYTYKIKILGKGGDIRIYGNAQKNGHIFFDKVMGH